MYLLVFVRDEWYCNFYKHSFSQTFVRLYLCIAAMPYATVIAVGVDTYSQRFTPSTINIHSHSSGTWPCKSRATAHSKSAATSKRDDVTNLNELCKRVKCLAVRWRFEIGLAVRASWLDDERFFFAMLAKKWMACKWNNVDHRVNFIRIRKNLWKEMNS